MLRTVDERGRTLGDDRAILVMKPRSSGNNVDVTRLTGINEAPTYATRRPGEDTSLPLLFPLPTGAKCRQFFLVEVLLAEGI
jgi:hypothetical protein